MKNIKKILNGGFVKNVFLVAGGTAAAQLINTIVSPIITRVYSPEEFGAQTVYLSILTIFCFVGSLKYEGGIAIADDDDIAINVLALSMIALMFFVFIVSLIMFFWAKQFLELFGGGVLFKYRIAIPIGIFFVGAYNVFVQWSFRKKNFKSIARTKLNQVIIQNITKITFGFLRFGPIGLIFGTLFGQSAGITTLSIPLIKVDRGILRKINIKEVIRCSKRYMNFPLFTTPSTILCAIGLQLPIFFIARFYSSEIIGYYGLANLIVNLPMDLIGGSVGDVFYAEAASTGRVEPERLKSLSTKLLKKLIIIGLFPLITLVLFGPYLFSFIFGNEWYQAGVYSRILSFLVFARLIFTPISRIYAVFERQKEGLYLDILRIVLALAAFWISKYLALNSYWAVGLYSVSLTIVYLVTYFYAQEIISHEIAKKKVQVVS